ncbi:hypothetical protein KBC75_01410 [Candidatus Shapirobacteria bacterium]|nr:hypothetical protein [Candidatus Shapirobacteria bacterium]
MEKISPQFITDKTDPRYYQQFHSIMNGKHTQDLRFGKKLPVPTPLCQEKSPLVESEAK